MPDCFIIMPITTPSEYISTYSNDKDHFIHVLEHLFKPAVEKIGYKPISPVASGADIIHAEIIRQLEKADIVLCDISIHNPNVFFELGIRTAVDKPISILKDNITTNIPFDTGIINHHTYDHTLAPWILEREVSAISDHLLKSLNSSEGRNTLWRHFGLSTIARFKPNDSSLEEKLNFILLQLSNLRNLGPSAVTSSGGDPNDDDVQSFIVAAQAIAQTMAARFSIKEINGDDITLDLNGQFLGPALRQVVKNLGEECGYEVTILNDGEE